MNISGIIEESLIDGIGIRYVIFISGCLHHCNKCHNKETWDFYYGKEFNIQMQNKVIESIKNNPLIDGATISGGDSFYSAKEMIPFIQLLKKEIPNINIWVYTGFTYEELNENKNSDMYEYLKLIDVLVDGQYIEELKDLNLKFRGSSNQRIIDLKESLKQNKVILYME